MVHRHEDVFKGKGFLFLYTMYFMSSDLFKKPHDSASAFSFKLKKYIENGNIYLSFWQLMIVYIQFLCYNNGNLRYIHSHCMAVYISLIYILDNIFLWSNKFWYYCFFEMSIWCNSSDCQFQMPLNMFKVYWVFIHLNGKT